MRPRRVLTAAREPRTGQAYQLNGPCTRPPTSQPSAMT